MRSRIGGFPKIRFSWQKWIYTVYESAQHCPMCDRFNGFFNLSATYKSNSDFSSVYLTDTGVEWKKPTEEKRKAIESRDYLSEKTKFSYIMVSSCNAPSQRLSYLKELEKFVEVDIYGKCAKTKGKTAFYKLLF